MPITVKEIAWVAGLLEGEGCFVNKGTPKIAIQMTDLDVMEAYGKLVGKGLNPKPHGNRRRKNGGELKPCWVCLLTGRDAAQWMMTIYPLMGERRQEKIRECLRKWKTARLQGKGTDPNYPCGHPRTEENNTRRYKKVDGTYSKGCRTCFTAYCRRYRAKKAARLQGLST